MRARFGGAVWCSGPLPIVCGSPHVHLYDKRLLTVDICEHRWRQTVPSGRSCFPSAEYFGTWAPAAAVSSVLIVGNKLELHKCVREGALLTRLSQACTSSDILACKEALAGCVWPWFHGNAMHRASERQKHTSRLQKLVGNFRSFGDVLHHRLSSGSCVCLCL